MPYLVTPVVPAGRMRDQPEPVLRAAGGLVLRPWESGDAPVVLEAFQDPAIQQWNLRTLVSLEEAEAWIAQWEPKWLAERDGCWAVADDAGTVLGRVALRGIRLMDGVADCTYWVLPAARGRGAKAGFAVEGTLRSAMRHPDGWHDMHLHARVLGDPEPAVGPRTGA